MKIISNEKLIKRNGIISQVTSLSSLLILGSGMYISFSKPDYFTLSVAALLAGFILSQVGISLGNRFGRSPRPDELLDAGLKGLKNTYTIYHYSTPAQNLLVGPAGIWLLLPFHQHGDISYDGKKWKLKGGGFAQSYMRIFGQGNISRPDLDAGVQKDKLIKALKKTMAEEEIPNINAAIIFTSNSANVLAENAPIPTMHIKQLKSFIRKEVKNTQITKAEINAVNEALRA